LHRTDWQNIELVARGRLVYDDDDNDDNYYFMTNYKTNRILAQARSQPQFWGRGICQEFFFWDWGREQRTNWGQLLYVTMHVVK